MSAPKKHATREVWPIGRLRPNPENTRVHPPAQIETLRALIREFGVTKPALVKPDGEIVAGHGAWEAATAEGKTEFPVVVLHHLTDDQCRALALADNAVGEQSLWDNEAVRLELGKLEEAGFDLTLTGFSAEELEDLLADDDDAGGGDDGLNTVPKPPGKPTTKKGDVWLLGPHRVMCGDATQGDQAKKLLMDRPVDFMLMDPPYCSGGFQEAGKAAGSIGVRSKTATREVRPEIANDKLSTRGYAALLKGVLGNIEAAGVYCFTDWRMWISLYDLVEGSGYGVRSMIVWDKESAGMGQGWRGQHELVLFAAKRPVKFQPKNSGGNVIKSKRTGNLLHPTQKPVDLLCTILNVTDDAQIVCDPFAGSGSTLMACEDRKRVCYAMEMQPAYVDVIVTRWQDFFGKQATLEGDGRTFEAVKASRG